MPSINPLSNALGNLSLNANRSLLDPKQYEGFTVKVGKETSQNGVLGGVLSQDDYDKFKEIVKDINVKDASRNDMLTLYRGLIDAKLLTYEQVNFGYISGSVEFGPDGKGINQDAKYNQWDFQQKQLPTYAGSEFNGSRGGAINSMKLIAAVANASPVTGATVAKETYSPQDRNYSSGNSSSYAENTNSSTAATVSISSSAQARYIQSSATERQAAMSQGELKQLHSSTWSDIYNFSQLLGSKNYNKDDLLPQTDDPARLELGKKSLEYAISLHQSPPGNASNPFAGMARNDLSAVVYDDSGTYTMAERYAASAELRMQDEAYFSSLSAKLTNGGDNRDFFKSILDYFDDLPPVEKAAYPDGYRDSIDSLYQEQLDQWGPLALIKQATEEDTEKLSESIFKEGQSSQEMLQAVLEKAIGLSKAQ